MAAGHLHRWPVSEQGASTSIAPVATMAAMNSIHNQSFRPVRPQQLHAVHSPVTKQPGADSRAVDRGQRSGNTPGVYLPSRLDDVHARMAKDPANASAIYADFLQQVPQLVPGSAQKLRRMPVLASPQDLKHRLNGVGSRLAQQARQSGQGAILLSGHLRGEKNEKDAFRASLREARAAGIRRLVIEQPVGMADLETQLGVPVQQLIHQGQPQQLASQLARSGATFNRTIVSFINAAQNVQDARKQGMQVMLVDLAHLGATSSDGRNAALAETLMDMTAGGQGVMAAVPAFGVADLTNLIGLSGTPVEGVAYLSKTPEGVLSMGQFDTGRQTRLPNLSVLCVPTGSLAAQGPGPARRHPQQAWQAQQPGGRGHQAQQRHVQAQGQRPQAPAWQPGFHGPAAQHLGGGAQRRQRAG
jgi:hypothetical protein